MLTIIIATESSEVSMIANSLWIERLTSHSSETVQDVINVLRESLVPLCYTYNLLYMI